MSDTLDLTIDGAEAHVLEAALAVYRDSLHAARRLGGPAQEAAVLMDGPAARVQAKLHEAMYGADDPPEPEWLPDDADPVTLAKAHLDLEGQPEWNGAFR